MSRLRQSDGGWIVACALALTLVGCHQSPSPPPAMPEATPATAQLANGPSRNKLRAVGQGPVSPASAPTRSFALLMHALPAQQRVQVRDWYQRMGGPSMDDATPAQIAWMQARHYPMPEDIARAESMSEAQLRAAANTTDTTAQILHVARLLYQYNENAKSRAQFNQAEQLGLLVEIGRVMPQVLASGSPYAGYLHAAKARLMNPDNIELVAASQLAGLVWASKFGDTRAKQLMNAPTVQAVSAVDAASAMASILSKAMSDGSNPFVSAVVPIPPANH